MAYRFSNTIERFCFNHLNPMVTCQPFILNKKKTKDKYSNEVRFSATACSYRNFRIIGETAYVERYEHELNVVYKTMENYLTCLNDDPLSYGYIAFPLWTSISREKSGWLKDIFCTDEQRAALPSSLLIALKEKDKLVATIAFNNMPKLLERLNNLAAPYGANITDWNIPDGKAACSWWPEGMILENNFWLVPIEQLIDLAIVTKVGSNRFILGGKKNDQKRHRLNYLKEYTSVSCPECIRNDQFVGKIQKN